MAIRLSSRSEWFVPAWNDNRNQDDPVKFEIKSLTVADFWNLTVLVEQLQKAINKEASPEKASEMITLTDRISSVLETIVLNVSGLYVDDQKAGVPVISKHPALTSLLMELIVHILSNSSIDDATKKKLESISEIQKHPLNSDTGSPYLDPAISGFRSGES